VHDVFIAYCLYTWSSTSCSYRTTPKKDIYALTSTPPTNQHWHIWTSCFPFEVEHNKSSSSSIRRIYTSLAEVVCFAYIENEGLSIFGTWYRETYWLGMIEANSQRNKVVASKLNGDKFPPAVPVDHTNLTGAERTSTLQNLA